MTRRIPTLDIVIVNWNSGDYLRDCLASIPASLADDFALARVVVVDNASTDAGLRSAQAARSCLPLDIIANDTNAGFAKGCNQGALLSKADYILFLNPDTRLFPQSLSTPLRHMEEAAGEKVGIVSVKTLGADGNVKPSCARFPRPAHFLARSLGIDTLFPGSGLSSLMTEWSYTEDRDVDQVIGAFFLIRRALFEALGGFDERYFVYFEEVDLSLRAARLGWKSRFLAGAGIFHAGGGSSSLARPQRLYYSLRSRLIYSATHFPAASHIAVSVATLCVEFATRLVFSLVTLSPERLAETLGGYARAWTHLPDIIHEGRADFRSALKAR